MFVLAINESNCVSSGHFDVSFVASVKDYLIEFCNDMGWKKQITINQMTKMTC